MELPLILINFKTYLEALGKRALQLAKIAEEVAQEYKVSIAVAPQYFDLDDIVELVRIPVFAQHIDPIERDGMHTGYILAESLKRIGAAGTLINHSERRLELSTISKCIEIAQKAGLITVCCAENLEKARLIALMGPDFIAIEPPELIGTGIPISRAKPEIVRDAVKEIHAINPTIDILCGAGIGCGEDVRRALELGTAGVLVASAIVKADEPKRVLVEFAQAIESFRSEADVLQRATQRG